MRMQDLVNETLTALSANRTRSSLTILGIVIGISSVITMTALGTGAQSSIQSSIQSIGSNLILITPGSQGGPGSQISSGRGSAKTLTKDDADAIATNISGVEAVAPELSSRYQVTARGTNTNTSVVGVTNAYPTVRNVDIAEGSFITEMHVHSLAKVAVLGPTARDDLFGTDVSDVVGQEIRINGMVFKVIGVTSQKGGSGFGSQDDMIFIPLSSAQRFLAGSSYVTTVSVQASDAADMSGVQEDITNLLLERHNISDATAADFSTMNQTDIVSTATSVTQTLTWFLAAVAGISLLVGGIGIMNMMLTTVTERTREIGLRKAVGAREGDIRLQFLTEAIMLTVIGGVIGIILGWLIALALGAFLSVAASVSVASVVIAFGVSAVIGIAFGYYPARRASRLNPIDALRYE